MHLLKFFFNRTKKKYTQKISLFIFMFFDMIYVQYDCRQRVDFAARYIFTQNLPWNLGKQNLNKKNTHKKNEPELN